MNPFKPKLEKVSDLAITLAQHEELLEQHYLEQKQNLKDRFLAKIKNIISLKKENVEYLNKSIESITEKRDNEQDELEAAQSKLEEMEEK